MSNHGKQGQGAAQPSCPSPLHFQRGTHFGGCSVPTNTGDFIRLAGAVGAASGNTVGSFRAQSMIEACLAIPGGSNNVFYIPGGSVPDVRMPCASSVKRGGHSRVRGKLPTK